LYINNVLYCFYFSDTEAFEACFRLLHDDDDDDYNSHAVITEYNDLSQFKEDTGGPSVPVREINLIAYLPLVQPMKTHALP